MVSVIVTIVVIIVIEPIIVTVVVPITIVSIIMVVVVMMVIVMISIHISIRSIMMVERLVLGEIGNSFFNFSKLVTKWQAFSFRVQRCACNIRTIVCHRLSRAVVITVVETGTFWKLLSFSTGE